MKITAKNVGIIIFLIAIFCLAFVCCNNSVYSLSILNNFDNKMSELDTQTANVVNDLPEVEEEITLTCDCPANDACTCGKMASDWSTIMAHSVTTRKACKVVLGKDWLAPIDEDTNNAFCLSGTGFANGRINIPASANIILDLAGFDIDRRLTTAQKTDYGNNMRVAGTLHLIDSSYDKAQAQEYYEQGKISEYECGKITGGSRIHNQWGGGGMVIEHTTGVLNMYGGMIGDNYSYFGGGIFAYHNSLVNIYDGIICSNSSEIGGGIYSSTGSELNIYGGYIIDNSAVTYGSAIYTESTKFSLKNCVIEDNNTQTKGGVISITGSSKFKLYSTVKFKNNTSNGKTNDILLQNQCRIELMENIQNYQTIYVDFGEGYNLFAPFTLGYKYYANGGSHPENYFKHTQDIGKKAVLIGEEVRFDYSVNSDYDFAYLENSTRKYYKDNDKLHGYNDTNEYVLGKIAPYTSVNDFISNIEAYNFSNIVLYDNKGNIVYQNGTPVDNTLSSNGMELAVGTGWRIQCQYNGVSETIYLSVLGDLTGDGKVNSADVNYIRQIIKDSSLFENASLALKLSVIINNKGNGLQVSDTEILWNIVCSKMDIADFI